MNSGSLNFMVELLRQSGVGEPLIGDVVEEHARDRSRRWLWKQALAAVGRTAVRDLRGHKLLALRAVATGTVTIVVASAVKFSVTLNSLASGLVIYWILTLLSFLFAGWVVGRTHRQHRAGMVLAFLCYAVLAKSWLYTSHFMHYWKLEGLEWFFLDAALTCVGFGMIVVGGLLPAWQERSEESC
jgi:hypothetical protein